MALAKPSVNVQAKNTAAEADIEVIVGEHSVVVETENEVQHESEREVVETGTTVATTTRVAPPAMGGTTAMAAQVLADAGFEGMELDSFSFTTIRLPSEGFFDILGQEDSDLGKEFVFRPESAKPRYVVAADDSDDAESFHSYDPQGLVKQDGTSTESTIAQWRADSGEGDGYHPQIKRYLDVVATIVDGDMEKEDMARMVEDNETVMLSIAPASVTKFWGKFKLGSDKHGIGNFLLRASVGKKVKTKSGQGFYPWMFDLVKDQ